METGVEHPLARNLERLLKPWADRDGPGVTIGIVLDGALALHRSAGYASIEHRVPIGPDTRFRIASVSKQFTCAAILMLAHEGRLSIEDKATSYLPELPEFGITVAHLMHNTSGIRDMLEIMRHGGADLGTPVPLSALVDGICRQRTLNFTPGTRFLYSNSNFLLLGLIAERVGGKPLPDMLDDRIFAPLGMCATLMTPDLQTVIPDLATGYLDASPGTWRRAPHAFPLGGEGGLVSTVADLALWNRNLDTGEIGGDWLAAALSQQTPFLNGIPNRYARGQVVQAYRGQHTVSHGGLWPGYRTEFLRLPQQGVAIIVISNDGAAIPSQIAHHALDAVLDGRPHTHLGVYPVPALPPAAVTTPMAGRFMDPATGATLDIAITADGHPTLATNGMVVKAEATDDGALTSPRSSSVFAVRPAADGVDVEQDAGIRSVWTRLPGGATLPDGLAGTWHSPEMAATWTVAIDAGTAEIHATGPAAASPAWPVEPIAPDLVRVHIPGTLFRAWMDVRVIRADGHAIALEASGGRTKAVRYERVA